MANSTAKRKVKRAIHKTKRGAQRSVRSATAKSREATAIGLSWMEAATDAYLRMWQLSWEWPLRYWDGQRVANRA
jgi:hypothetical protein